MNNALQYIISQYLSCDDVTTSSVPFGLTNTTCFVHVEDETFVARHYNIHTKSVDSLHLELELTSFLQKSNLSYQIPKFLPTIDGRLIVQLEDGSLGALLSYIKGDTPQLHTMDDAYAIGKTVGELSKVLSTYNGIRNLPYKGIPFTHIYNVHPLINEEVVQTFIEQASFISKEQRNFYYLAIKNIKAHDTSLHQLPRQFVHHDLLVFNILSVERQITGILDFDFISYDIACMDFFITLNHVLHLSHYSLEMVTEYIKGYLCYHTLNKDEITAMRNVITLYHIAILHIYVGQHEAGKDISSVFNYIMKQMVEAEKWFMSYEQQLQSLISHIIAHQE